MQPTSSDVHVNVALTTISIAYIQDQSYFIADQVFPNVPVEQQSNRYYIYNKGDWLRTEAEIRGPGSESRGSGYRLDNTPTYYANVYAVHKDVDDQVRANSDAVLNTDRDATQWVTQQMLIKRDLVWASQYFKTGVWDTERAGVASGPTGTQFLRWDVAGSTPIEDVTSAVVSQVQNTGFKPNVLVLSPFVFNALKNHAEVLDRIKYTQRGIVTTDLLAALFDVDKVVIAYAVQNTAAEGATASMSFVFGKHALLLYANPTPSIMTPSAGYTFSWTGWFGATGLGLRIKQFRKEDIESDRIEAQMAFDMKVVATDCGYMFLNAVS